MSSYQYDSETAIAGSGESGSDDVADLTRPRAVLSQRSYSDRLPKADLTRRPAETASSSDAEPRLGDSRDEAAARRDMVADLRDKTSVLRDLAAEDHDLAAQRRDLRADLRDEAASRRDGEAARRDQMAEHCNNAHSDSGVAGASDGESGPVQINSSPVHSAAAKDRADAAFDRRACADERAAAAKDRGAASATRRGHAAERLAAEQDRRSAQSDRSAAAAERERAVIDGLTGVLLRRAGFEALEREMVRARRIGAPLIVAFFDVDHLKQVNDTRGHAAGDQVLVRIAEALRANLRSCDLVIRYGGDEFVCVLTGLDMAAASRRFELVAQTLSENSDQASVTVGVAEMRRGETAADVVARADQSLYEVRHQQRQLPHRVDRTA